jgi:hypothetical protein
MLVQRGGQRLSNRALDPGVPALARVELGKFAHAFRPDARVTLWRDPAHRSLLHIGVLDDVLVPEAPPSCGEVLGQPCRIPSPAHTEDRSRGQSPQRGSRQTRHPRPDAAQSVHRTPSAGTTRKSGSCGRCHHTVMNGIDDAVAIVATRGET